MIYTITLNPALDRTVWVNQILPDESNRIEHEQSYAGGKGIDVSKVLEVLGANTRALGFVGGFAGEELQGLLVNRGIACDFTTVSGETRTNVVINDKSTGNQTVLSARGPEIEPYELMQMIHKVERIENPQVVAISGSLPPGVHAEIYRRLIDIARGKGARVILDTDGDALKVGLRSFPDAIKPNVHELGRLVGRELKDMDEIIAAAGSIREQGTPIVLVSMGAKGILMVTEKARFVAVPPKVKVRNTIGAGDSAVAGFVYGLVEGKGLKTALTYAVAAGTATTLRDGTALCRKDDFLELVPKVSIKPV